MGNIYEKLDLDFYPVEKRRQVLHQVYCPALQEEEIEPVETESDTPTPVPDRIMQMVEDDEKAIIPYQTKPPQVIEIVPPPAETRPPRRLRGFLGGCLVGVILAAILGIVIWQFLGGGRLFTPITTEVIAVQPEPTEQPISDLETPAPIVTVEEVVVVVTATPEPASLTVSADTATSIPSTPTSQPPTNTPRPTEPQDTVPGTRLQPGETWKQDGFHLTLERVRFDTFQGQGEVWLGFSVTNRTGAPISVELFQEDITVEASNGTRFVQDYSTSSTVWRETLNHGDKADVWLSARTNYAWIGDYFSTDVEYILVTVRNWSRITEAFWQIDVDH
jgi:hypothetical protein